MKKKKIILVYSILMLILLTLGLTFKFTCMRIESYKLTKAYEDLSFVEKLVVNIEGYPIYTRDQLVKSEAAKITSILKKIEKLTALYDDKNKTVLDEEIQKCDEILDELHKENSSGNVTNDSLVYIMDNSISAVENHKSGLKSFKSGNLNTYSDFAKKSDADIQKVVNELERLGITK